MRDVIFSPSFGNRPSYLVGSATSGRRALGSPGEA